MRGIGGVAAGTLPVKPGATTSLPSTTSGMAPPPTPPPGGGATLLLTIPPAGHLGLSACRHNYLALAPLILMFLAALLI